MAPDGLGGVTWGSSSTSCWARRELPAISHIGPSAVVVRSHLAAVPFDHDDPERARGLPLLDVVLAVTGKKRCGRRYCESTLEHRMVYAGRPHRELGAWHDLSVAVHDEESGLRATVTYGILRDAGVFRSHVPWDRYSDAVTRILTSFLESMAAKASVTRLSGNVASGSMRAASWSVSWGGTLTKRAAGTVNTSAMPPSPPPCRPHGTRTRRNCRYSHRSSNPVPLGLQWPQGRDGSARRPRCP
jgi:hypothetical protein